MPTSTGSELKDGALTDISANSVFFLSEDANANRRPICYGHCDRLLSSAIVSS